MAKPTGIRWTEELETAFHRAVETEQQEDIGKFIGLFIPYLNSQEKYDYSYFIIKILTYLQASTDKPPTNFMASLFQGIGHKHINPLLFRTHNGGLPLFYSLFLVEKIAFANEIIKALKLNIKSAENLPIDSLNKEEAKRLTHKLLEAIGQDIPISALVVIFKKLGANLATTSNDFPKTPLHAAIIRGNSPCVKALLAIDPTGKSLSYKTYSNKRTPLHYTVIHNQPTMLADFLIKSSKSGSLLSHLGDRDDLGCNILHYVALRTDNAEAFIDAINIPLLSLGFDNSRLNNILTRKMQINLEGKIFSLDPYTLAFIFGNRPFIQFLTSKFRIQTKKEVNTGVLFELLGIRKIETNTNFFFDLFRKKSEEPKLNTVEKDQYFVAKSGRLMEAKKDSPFSGAEQDGYFLAKSLESQSLYQYLPFEDSSFSEKKEYSWQDKLEFNGSLYDFATDKQPSLIDGASTADARLASGKIGETFDSSLNFTEMTTACRQRIIKIRRIILSTLGVSLGVGNVQVENDNNNSNPIQSQGLHSSHQNIGNQSPKEQPRPETEYWGNDPFPLRKSTLNIIPPNLQLPPLPDSSDLTLPSIEEQNKILLEQPILPLPPIIDDLDFEKEKALNQIEQAPQLQQKQILQQLEKEVEQISLSAENKTVVQEEIIKAAEARDESLQNLSNQTPPPPPLPIESGIDTRRVLKKEDITSAHSQPDLAALLAAIRKGAELKPLAKKSPPGTLVHNTLKEAQSLQNVLSNALEARRAVIGESHEPEEESNEDWKDEPGTRHSTNPSFFSSSKPLPAKSLIDQAQVTINDEGSRATISFDKKEVACQFEQKLMAISNNNNQGEANNTNIDTSLFTFTLTANEYNTLLNDENAFEELKSNLHQAEMSS